MILKDMISDPDRQNVKYYLSNFKWQDVGEVISAYANNNGGFLIFGVIFDGVKVIPKSFPYEFKIDEILDNLNNSKIISHGIESFEGHDIYYIQVFASEIVIKFHNIAYSFDRTSSVSKLVTKKVFLSYSWIDENVVDVLQQDLNIKYADRITLTRDRDSLGYKDSLEEFMRRVKNHDFVISVISDSYLKSKACMYEMSELMRDRDYFEKLLFITVKDEDMKYYQNQETTNIKPGIYGTGYVEYKIYWQEKKEELTIKSARLDLANMVLLAKDAKQIDMINYNLDDLLQKLGDSIGKGFSELKEENYKYFDRFLIG